MDRFEARVMDGPHLWALNQVTLAVRDGESFLMSDGTWRVIPEGQTSEEVGIRVPRAAIEAIAVAVQEWQGHTSHADTEARVLREWLASERERVNSALLAVLRDITPVLE